MAQFFRVGKRLINLDLVQQIVVKKDDSGLEYISIEMINVAYYVAKDKTYSEDYKTLLAFIEGQPTIKDWE